jgi:hypothetical protein
VYLDNGRVTSPLIRRNLWTLLDFGWTIQLTRVFLINSNLIRSSVQLSGYLDFAKRCFFHIKNHGYAAAIPLIQADVDLFKSWGFSASLLQSLALSQGVVIEKLQHLPR